jgi:hypothetical protein
MNYGEIIKEAFWITLRNRFLWFFGFFISGGIGSSNFNPSAGGPGDFDGGLGDAPPAWFSEATQWVTDNLALVITVIVAVGVLVLVFIVLTLISQGALAESVAALHRGEARRFSSAWRAGSSNFWRVLGQALLFILIGLVLFIGLALLVLVLFVPLSLLFGAISSDTGSGLLLSAVLIGLFIILGLFFFVLFIALVVAFYIVGQLALRELVVGGKRVLESIGAGYRLFRRNLGRSLLIWLIQVAISIGVWIAALIILALFFIVFIGPGAGLFIADYTAAGIAVGALGFLLFLIPYLVISGAIGTFNHAYWTLAYLRLIAPVEETALRPDEGV